MKPIDPRVLVAQPDGRTCQMCLGESANHIREAFEPP